MMPPGRSISRLQRRLSAPVLKGMLLVAAPCSALPALAQSGEILEEVIVNARRSSENIQIVPVAVSVFTAEDLRNRGIVETSDLMGSSPNLQVTSAYAQTQPNFTIRGIGVANEFTAPTASAVGVYVDEVYQSFRAAHGMQLFDLQQVEILRGPQGTLFGKNTTGGTVLIETRRPRMVGRDGYVKAGFGNYSSQELEAAYEDMIGENVGFRLAGLMRAADGYTHNPVDGRDYGELDSQALRLTVQWDATDALEGSFRFNYGDNDALGDLAYGIGYLAGGRNILAVDPVTKTIIPGSPGLRTGLAEDEVASNSGNGFATSANGAGMTWRYSFGDFELVSITGFDKGKFHLSPYDCDGSAVSVCATRYYSESKSINEDLRLHWNSDAVRVITGIYLGEEEVKTANEVDGFAFLNGLLGSFGIPSSFFNAPIASKDSLGVVPDGTASCRPIVLKPNGFFDARSFLDPANCQRVAPPYSSVRADQNFTLERPTRAIYGEANLKLPNDFGLTLGLRHTWDDVDYLDARTVFLSADGVPRASTVPYSFPYNPKLPPVERHEQSSEWSGRLVVDRQFTGSLFAYASYSHGYRAGTYNGLAYQDIEQVYFVQPETVDAWELGFKTRFAQNRVQLNAALFQYEYKHQQIAEIVGFTSFLRAVDGNLWGGELELKALFSERLSLSAELGLLESEYDDNQRLYAGGAFLDIGGNHFANAPEQTFSTTLDWSIGSFMGGDLAAALSLQYMGEYYFDPFGDYNGQYIGSSALSGLPLASQELGGGNPDYWLANARLGYQRGNFEMTAWVKNATDKFYYTYGINLNSLYQDYMTRGLPRTYGLQATYRFN